ncbi:hypothetical protein TruAng_003654 [Truncatella angustata]|nr:hypothetical protein TruAng_003654 [Truncatella angustata]
MDHYSSTVSASPSSARYGAGSDVSFDSDYNSDQADAFQDQQSLPDSHIGETASESESEGGLFVEQDRSSPASIITLSASEPGSDHSRLGYGLPEPDLGPGLVNGLYLGNDPDEFDQDYDLESELERELVRGNIDIISSDSEGTVGQEPHGSPSPDPLHIGAHQYRLLVHDDYPQPGSDDSGESEDLDFDNYDFDDELDNDHLFGDAFGESEEEDFGEGAGDAEFLGLPEPVPHHHHHHHQHHHHFHHPRLAAVHPDRHSPIVLGINPLQHLVPNFLPPHLHEHLRRASSSPALSPNRVPRMEARNQQRDELVGVELGRGRANSAQNNNVIDLTLDDEDVEIVNGSQNARRQQSQRRDNAPRLNRSDGSYVGNRNVIELSSDSEDDVQIHRVNAVELQPAAAAAAANHHRHHHHHVYHHHAAAHHHHRAAAAAMERAAAMNQRQQRRMPAANNVRADDNSNRGFFNMAMNGIRGVFGVGVGNRRGDDGDVVMLGAGPAAILPIPNMPNFGHIQLDYGAHPFRPPQPAPGPQKPPHEAPPKAREGFTRDTEGNSPVVCPSCDEELAFDPDDGDENGPPAKKARTKKDKAEHHFWAVKECGHVFCKKCYENRKPTIRNPVKVGFKTSPQNNKKILCAVDDCNSDVSSKTAWVGIFL